MDRQALLQMEKINRAVIRYRAAYSAWAGARGLSYTELLVLYSVREEGVVTLKRISERYLLPRQTVHHALSALRAAGLLAHCREKSEGREKALVLTEEGRAFAAPHLAALDEMESRALERVGGEKTARMTEWLEQFGEALWEAQEG